jgi:hypothetical protein
MKKEAESFKTFQHLVFSESSTHFNLVSQRDSFYPKIIIALIKVLVPMVGSQTETYCSLKNHRSKYVDV